MKNRITGISFNRKKNNLEVHLKNSIPPLGYGALKIIKMMLKFLKPQTDRYR
jgi:hypothetical protein